VAGWSGSAGENWPQFRGRDGLGVSKTEAPATWNIASGEGVRWQAEVPGLGHGNPVIWGDRLYVATAVRPDKPKTELRLGLYGDIGSYAEKVPHEWRLLCYDKASGRLLWDRQVHEAVPRQERHTKGSHCNSTPATDGTRLVTYLGSEGLFCFDMEGKLLWRKDLGKMDAGYWAAPSNEWGFAGSPVLHAGKVIVQCDTISEQFVAAYGATDGREIWRTARKEVANWCTPAIAPVNGQAQIVLNGWKEIAGYDFETGKRIWNLAGGGDLPVPAPLIADGFAFFTSAHGNYRPIRAVELAAATGEITPPSMEATNQAVRWCHPRLGSYMQTPLALGKELWSCDWMGILTCMDRATGRIHYSERLGQGRQAFTASGIAAGNRLYFASESGDVFVVPASTTFSVMATNALGEPCLATPAAADGTLYFRTTGRLVAIGSR